MFADEAGVVMLTSDIILDTFLGASSASGTCLLVCNHNDASVVFVCFSFVRVELAVATFVVWFKTGRGRIELVVFVGVGSVAALVVLETSVAGAPPSLRIRPTSVRKSSKVPRRSVIVERQSASRRCGGLEGERALKS